MGLKPVIGEPRDLFVAMQADPAVCERLAREARARLSSRGDLSKLRPAPYFVDPEEFRVDAADVVAPAVTREMQRIEARLVRRYRAWLDPAGSRLRGVAIPAGGVTLRADLFDTELGILIEAKGTATREHLRYAVGQLLDYQRYLTPRPKMALLLPEPLSGELAGLPAEADIGIIWSAGAGFADSLGGRLTS